MSRRGGMTLVELLMGVVAAGILAVISANLFQVGIKTYNYTMRQNRALASAAKAFKGEGSNDGILMRLRAGKTVQSLSSDSVAIVSTASVVTTFAVSGASLYKTVSGSPTLQASDINALAVTYYNIDPATGLIVESTAAASATLVAVSVTVTGSMSADKIYTFYSGARLRNY